jgi:hypothetical protein
MLICFKLCQILWVSVLLSIFIGLSQMEICWHNSTQKQLNSKVVFVTMMITHWMIKLKENNCIKKLSRLKRA